MKRDLMNHLHPVVAIPPQGQGNEDPIVSEIIDTKGHSGLALIIATGPIVAAACNATILIEDGDEADMSDAEAVNDDQLVGSEELAGFTQEDDNSCRKIGYIGYKRYVRMTVTPVDNDATMWISAIAVFGMSEQQPMPNPPE